MCTLRLIWVISIEIAPSADMCSASVQNILRMESSIIDSKHMAKWNQLLDDKTEFQILNENSGARYLKKAGDTQFTSVGLSWKIKSWRVKSILASNC